MYLPQEAVHGHQLRKGVCQDARESGAEHIPLQVLDMLGPHVFALVPAAHRLVIAALGAGVGRAEDPVAAHPVDFLRQAGEAGGIGVDAAAPAAGGGADLKPEGGAVLAGGAVPQGKPQVVLVGSPAEEPPCVPVDAGDVALNVQLGKALLQQRAGLFGQVLEGLVQAALKLLFMFEKPGALVVKAQLPQKFPGLLGKALKHR